MANLSNINNKFLVTTGGNVLIGQTSTIGSSMFQVTGDSTFTPISTVNFIVTNSGNALRLIAGLPSGVTWVGKPVEYYASKYSFSTDVTGIGGYSQQFRIENNGNVGIGALSDPVKKLQVSDSAAGDLINILCVNRRDQNGDTASIGFSMTDNNLYNKAAVIFERTTTQGRGSLHFATNNVGSSANVSKADARMTILSGGDVGIGTISPNSKLQVDGNIRAENSSFLAGREDAAAPAHSFHDDADTGMFNINPNILGFSTAGTEKMRIESDGTSILRGLVKINTGAQASNPRLYFQHDNLDVNNFIEVDRGTGAMEFYNNGSERMRIRASGTIGIGAAGFDSQMLTIAAGTLDGAIYATSTDANCFASFRDNSSTANIEYGAIGNNHVFRKDASEQMRIDSSGNVGIGTATPSATTKLHIRNTTSNSYATLRLEGSNRGGILQMYQGAYPVSSIQTDQSGNTYFSTSGVFGSTTLSAKMAILTAGNVGIGTTSPEEKLHVRQDAGAGVNNFILELQNTTTVADSRAGILFSMNSSVGSARDGFAIQGSNNGVDGQGNLLFGNVLNNTFTERMRISTSGNVTKPNSCAFSANTTIPGFAVGTTEVKVTYSSEQVDDNDNYDGANARFTAPVTGTYLIGTANSCKITSGVTVYMAIYIRKNGVGTSYRFRGGGVDNDVNDWFGIAGSVVIPLAKDDYIELWAYANSGSFEIINTEGHFYGYLIG